MLLILVIWLLILPINAIVDCDGAIDDFNDLLACTRFVDKESWLEKDLDKVAIKSKDYIGNRYTIVDNKLTFCDRENNNTFYISRVGNLDINNHTYPIMGKSYFLIRLDGTMTTHRSEILSLAKSGNFLALSNIPRIVTRDFASKSKELFHFGSNHGETHVDLCKSISYPTKMLMICDWLSCCLFVLCCISVVTGVLLLLRFLKYCTCGSSSTVDYKNVRYVYDNGEYIRKPDRFSASRSQRMKKRYITLLCCTFPVTRGCDLIPFSQGEAKFCVKDNCTDEHVTSLALSYTGQIACMNLGSDAFKIQLLDVTHKCNQRLEYYTPVGNLNLKESWECSGNNCVDGKLIKKPWNVMSKSHPGGWFRGCGSWDDQCHKLELNFDSNYQMCKIISCPTFTQKYKFALTHKNREYIINVSPDTWFEIGTYKIYVPDNQRVVYGNKYVVCKGKMFKAGINARNEHDVSRVGSIQCPEDKLDERCGMSFDNLYKVDFEGNLIENIDFNYKSSLSVVTKLGEDISFDINNHDSLLVYVKTNNPIQEFTGDEKSILDNVTIEGTAYDYQSAIVNYQCTTVDVSCQFICPGDLIMYLHCWSNGTNSIKLSFIDNRVKTRLSCKTIDSSGNEATQIVYVNVGKPVLGLLKVEDMRMVDKDGISSWESSFEPKIWLFIQEHYIISSIIGMYTLTMGVHQLRLAL